VAIGRTRAITFVWVVGCSRIGCGNNILQKVYFPKKFDSAPPLRHAS
jgi:hypothetical protein